MSDISFQSRKVLSLLGSTFDKTDSGILQIKRRREEKEIGIFLKETSEIESERKVSNHKDESGAFNL